MMIKIERKCETVGGSYPKCSRSAVIQTVSTCWQNRDRGLYNTDSTSQFSNVLCFPMLDKSTSHSFISKPHTIAAKNSLHVNGSKVIGDNLLNFKVLPYRE